MKPSQRLLAPAIEGLDQNPSVLIKATGDDPTGHIV